VTAIGTSFSYSGLCCAVTTISSSADGSVAAGGALCAAAPEINPIKSASVDTPPIPAVR
jgi:hypothetical protein